VVAVLGLGLREGGAPFGEVDLRFLRNVATSMAAAIENVLLHDELRRLSRRMSANVFQLHNLFDISRDLAGGLEEKASSTS